MFVFHIRNALLMFIALWIPVVGLSQPVTKDVMLNTVTLTASVSNTIAQDRIRMRLFVERTNVDSDRLANELNQILNTALTETKKHPSIKSHTGNYRTWPVTDRKTNEITKWSGRGEIVLESEDFNRVSQLSTQLTRQGMLVDSVQFYLSEVKQAEIEKTLTDAALEAFKVKAQSITHKMGFQQYDLVEINVIANSPITYNRNVALSASVSKMSDESVPMALEAGTTEVLVQVNGRIRMR